MPFFIKSIFQYLSKNKTAYLFILPSIAVIVSLIFYPVIKTVMMSFTYWYIGIPKIRPPFHPFVGLENYRNVLAMSHFQKTILVTLIYTAVCVSGRMLVGLGTALVLSKKFVGRGIARGIMIIPWAMPGVVACIVFTLALDPAYGIVNSILQRLNFIETSIPFLSKTNWALISVIAIGIWRYFPFVTLMLLAALQGIPQSLYEAASIDGANIWGKFVSITWPLLRPVWSIVMLLQIIWTVKEFELIYLLTQGGPDYATATIGIDIYLNAFRFFRMGTAAAEGMILLSFSVIFSIVYFKFLRKGESI